MCQAHKRKGGRSFKSKAGPIHIGCSAEKKPPRQSGVPEGNLSELWSPSVFSLHQKPALGKTFILGGAGRIRKKPGKHESYLEKPKRTEKNSYPGSLSTPPRRERYPLLPRGAREREKSTNQKRLLPSRLNLFLGRDPSSWNGNWRKCV